MFIAITADFLEWIWWWILAVMLTLLFPVSTKKNVNAQKRSCQAEVNWKEALSTSLTPCFNMIHISWPKIVGINAKHRRGDNFTAKTYCKWPTVEQLGQQKRNLLSLFKYIKWLHPPWGITLQRVETWTPSFCPTWVTWHRVQLWTAAMCPAQVRQCVCAHTYRVPCIWNHMVNVCTSNNTSDV